MPMRQKVRQTPTTGLKQNIYELLGYILGPQIAVGSYSRVYVAARKKGHEIQEKVACKVIDKNFASRGFIRKFLPRELRVLTMVKHPHIVGLRKIVDIRDSICIFLEYCENGDLLEYIRERGPLKESKAKRFFGQIVSAVEYLHNRKLVHRDLKCENVLLTAEYNVKLADFGFCRSYIDEKTKKEIYSRTYCGSAAYAAPEVVKGIPYDPRMYDTWSLGCILFIMLSASMPFDDSNHKRMLDTQLGKKANYSKFVSWALETPSLINLMDHLLEPDVKKRATVQNIVHCRWLNE